MADDPGAARRRTGQWMRRVRSRPRRTASCGSSALAPIPTMPNSRPAGVAAKWAAAGHHVKFVSVTNGDIGHWRTAGGPLAQRRNAEVQQAAKVLGIESEVLDIHDGELEPTLENRRKITRLIRDWKADVVMSHRPNDYHPDHRYTGILVQDAAFMVTVPFFCPDTPPLKNNPAFFYYSDRFQKPNPFTPDVIVAIDDVMDKKLAAVHSLPSQVYEGGSVGLRGIRGRRARGRSRPPGLGSPGAWRTLCRGGRQVSRRAGQWYGAERGEEGEVCRGLRDLRIRPRSPTKRSSRSCSRSLGTSSDPAAARRRRMKKDPRKVQSRLPRALVRSDYRVRLARSRRGWPIGAGGRWPRAWCRDSAQSRIGRRHVRLA